MARSNFWNCYDDFYFNFTGFNGVKTKMILMLIVCGIVVFFAGSTIGIILHVKCLAKYMENLADFAYKNYMKAEYQTQKSADIDSGIVGGLKEAAAILGSKKYQNK